MNDSQKVFILRNYLTLKCASLYQTLKNFLLWQEDLGEVSEKEWEQALGGYMWIYGWQ